MRDDIRFAERSSAQAYIAKQSRIIGYRRVVMSPRPCALCSMASTQRYTTGTMLPVHSNCSCEIAEIYGKRPETDAEKRQFKRDRVIDSDRLASTHKQIAAAEKEAGKKLSRHELSGVQVDVKNHSELGPTLVTKGDNFMGINDIKNRP